MLMIFYVCEKKTDKKEAQAMMIEIKTQIEIVFQALKKIRLNFTLTKKNNRNTREEN